MTWTDSENRRMELEKELAKAEAERDAVRTNHESIGQSLALAEAARDAARLRAEAAEAALAKSCDAGIALAVELDCTKAALATARAVAMRDAAEWASARGLISGRMYDAICALAPLPAGLVVVPVETAKRLNQGLKDLYVGKDPWNSLKADCEELEAALEALKAVKR